MPYGFNFDLSRLSRSFFREIAMASNEKDIHKKLGNKARYLTEKFRINEITGLNVSDALLVIEDLIDVYIKNCSYKEKFSKTGKRALFLPHCARKYMDNRCQSRFDAEEPSYRCTHCSPDCLVNRATTLAEKRGYDVYILPGNSCLTKIIKKKSYEGIVGVACCEELKLSAKYLEQNGLPGQAIPLIRNGCANTEFNLQNLETIL